jgi:hypothetical protein
MQVTIFCADSENKTEHCGQMGNLLCIKKGPSSLLSQDTDCLDSGSSWFLQSVQAYGNVVS